MITVAASLVGGALQPAQPLPDNLVEIRATSTAYECITATDVAQPSASIGTWDRLRYVGSLIVAETLFGLHFNKASSLTSLSNYRYGTVRCHDAGCRWDLIEASANGVYNWSALDAFVSANAGKDIIYTVIGVPPGYSSDAGGAQLSPFKVDGVRIAKICSNPTAAGKTALAAFLTALCARYPQVRYFEIWNESNSDGDGYQWWWGTQQNLADIIKVVHDAVKAGNAQNKVLACSCVGFVVTGSARNYTEQVLALTATGDSVPIHNRVDILTAHLYARDQEPVMLFETVAQLQAARIALGMTEKPIWDTESGFLQLERDQIGQALTDQQYIRRYFAHTLIAGALGVERVCWYTADHGYMGFATRPTVVGGIRNTVNALIGRQLDIYYHASYAIAIDAETGEKWTF